MKINEFMYKLDETIVGQNSAKKQFITAIYQSQGINMLISGPSGCGKTFLVDTYCNLKGIPCCHIDASKLTQTGFAGNKIEEYLSDFVNAHNGNLTTVEHSVIFIDEFDKLKITDNKFANSDIANVGVQYELLKFFDGNEIIVDYNHRKLTVKTENMTIICAGAFSGINHKIDSKEDLVDSGFIEELAGRICTYISMNTLKQNDFYNILKTKKCHALEKIKDIYKELDEIFFLSDDEMMQIAEKCALSPFGVRALESEVYKKYQDVIFDMLIKHNVDI